VRLVKFGDKKIEISDTPELKGSFSNRLASFLFNETNEKWIITLLDEAGDEPLYAQEMHLVSKEPIIEGILNAFPGSKISNIEKNTLGPK